MDAEELLSGLDDFWLRIEHPRRLMTVSGLWLFEKRLDSRQVYHAIDDLCERFPRYGMVPAHGSLISTAEWTPALGWEPRMNVIQHQLKEPTEEALQNYVADQIARPFIYSKPLWELHAISGLQGDRCAFLWKAHHCLADGHGFISSLWDITQHSNNGKEIHSGDEQDDNSHQHLHNNHDHLRSNNSSHHGSNITTTDTRKKPPTHRHDGIPDPIWTLLPKWLQCLIVLCIEAYAFAQTLIHDLWVCIFCLLPGRWSHHRDLYYDGLQAHRKQIAWSEPIRMKDIRVVQQALHGQGTVNDIMVLVVTRCIKNYLEQQQNVRKEDKYVRFLIPMSQRSKGDSNFQNVVSGTWGWFSMQEISTKPLFHQVRREMLAIKASKMPRLLYEWFLQRVLVRVPGLVNLFQGSIVNRLADIPHAVFTNLPGPTHPVEFGGQRIADFRVLPPQSGKGSLAIGLVSYNGRINISVLADDHPRYPRLATSICQHFAPEFELLVREASMDLTRR